MKILYKHMRSIMRVDKLLGYIIESSIYYYC